MAGGRRQSRRIGHSGREQLVGTRSSREYAQNIFRRIIVPRGEVMVSSVKCSPVEHNLTEHNFIAINSDSSRECSVRTHDWIVSREAAQVYKLS